jgi:hypothetical protein
MKERTDGSKKICGRKKAGRSNTENGQLATASSGR